MNKKPVFGSDIQNLYEMINQMDFDEGEGTEARYKIIEVYNDMINLKLTLKNLYGL